MFNCTFIGRLSTCKTTEFEDLGVGVQALTETTATVSGLILNVWHQLNNLCSPNVDRIIKRTKIRLETISKGCSSNSFTEIRLKVCKAPR